MTLPSRRVVLSLAIILAAAASPASGASNLMQQGPQTFHGWVTSVHRGNGRIAFRIRATQLNNAFGNAGNLVGVAVLQPLMLRFTVGPDTQFEAVQDINRGPASFALLRSGQRVMVQAVGQHATRVRILPSDQYIRRMSRPRYVGTRNLVRAPNMHRARIAIANQVVPNVASAIANRLSAKQAYVSRSATHVPAQMPTHVVSKKK